MNITYKNSGVNIDVADAAKKQMAEHIDKTNLDSRVRNKVGAFASLYDFNNIGVANPMLVLKTEEPGTKQLLAFAHHKVKNICYDMINHLTNDIIVMGATPLTVQDAIICGKLEIDVVPQIVKYVAEACLENGSVLTGGETSEQPGMLKPGTYVLTASIVGIVDADYIVDGSKIKKGDVVLALASNGIHTNGYSFLRRLMEEDPSIEECEIDGVKFVDKILEPHRSYYKSLKPLQGNENVVGLAHITGGGIEGNLNRILPENLDAEIDLSKIRVLPIFKFIKNKSNTADNELLRTFNMGVGMTVVVKQEVVQNLIAHFKNYDIDCYPIGEIVSGTKTVKYINKLEY